MTQIQRDSDPVRRVIGLAIVACTYGLHDYAAAALGSYCSLGLQNSAIARDALQTILDHDCVTGSWADYDRRLGMWRIEAVASWTRRSAFVTIGS